MGRFFADLDGSVPHGHPIEEVAQQIHEVLARHAVTVAVSPVRLWAFNVGFYNLFMRAVSSAASSYG
jgi:hypothetical protein